MGNIHSVAVYIFIVFYITYVLIALFVLAKALRRTRNKIPITRLLRQSGQVNITLNGIAVTTVAILSVYVMGKWISQQVLNGCMTISWWNMTCYDMNDFNRAWAAVFVVIGINALLLTFIFDTKQQDRRLNR